MEGLEKLYLLFSTDGLYYLLPVSKMERILDGRDIPDGLAVADVSEITGGSGDMGKSDRQYIILLKEEGGHGLLVEHITGMLEVHEGELISLPEPVLKTKRRYGHMQWIPGYLQSRRIPQKTKEGGSPACQIECRAALISVWSMAAGGCM